MTHRDRVLITAALIVGVICAVAFALIMPLPDTPKVSDHPPVIGTTRYPITIDGDVWWCLTDQPPERGEPLRVTAETELLDCLREVEVHG